jgi:hypothetical protein
MLGAAGTTVVMPSWIVEALCRRSDQWTSSDPRRLRSDDSGCHHPCVPPLTPIDPQNFASSAAAAFVHFGCRYFSYLIRLNANLNNNLPPPFFEGMRKFRGW